MRSMRVVSLFVWIVIILAISAFFVAAEFATVAAKPVKVESLQETDAAARRLLPYIQDANKLDRYVATCQIGITVASLVLGAIGDKFITPVIWQYIKANWGANPFGLNEALGYTIVGVVVVLLFTAVQLIFGELLPKAIAVRNVEQVAMRLIFPMEMAFKSLSFIIDLFNGSSDAILRACGVTLTESRHIHSREELSTLVEHVDDEGESLEKNDRERIKRALRFDEIIASDIMVPRNRMVCINADSKRTEVIKLVVNSPYTRFPVYRGSEDNIIGILHIKQLLLTSLRTKSSSQSIERFINKDWFVFCPGTITLDKVMDRLREKHASMAIIGDEYGGTAGLLTIEDMMEEVLGDIRDEFDSKVSEVEFKSIDSNHCVVSGTLTLEELQEDHDIDLLTNADGSPDEIMQKIHTVGGLVMHLSEGNDIDVGFEAAFKGYKFTALKVKGHAVLQVRIAKEGSLSSQEGSPSSQEDSKV